jgi:hypothetical protein
MKLASIAHELAPGLTLRILSAVNRMLPAMGGVAGRRRRGVESTSAWSPSLLTTLNERAAKTHNQFSVDS